MFEQAISKDTQAVLALLGKSRLLKDAYLAGGTAAALHLGHRFSFDLDFFTPTEFDENLLAPEIGKLPKFKLDKLAWRTIMGRFGTIKFSFFYYAYPLLFPTQPFGKVQIADLRDIAAMKIAAIADRGIKRDFIDLYFICNNVPLEEIILIYDRKYRNLSVALPHILKSLAYFEDAEQSEMPRMIKKIKWGEIKKFFSGEARQITLKFAKK